MAIKKSSLELYTCIWIYSISFLSAFMNVGAFLNYGYSLSHYTGNFIEIINDIYLYHRISGVLILISFSLLFMLGATIASFVNQNKSFNLQGRYGEVQLIIGMTLLFIYIVINNEIVFLLFTSMSLGVQNGLIRVYKGMGFKITHITGTLSDLGSYIGYYLSGDKSNKWKITFQSMLLLSFAFGTFAGILTHTYLQHIILLIGSILYICLGLLYFILRRNIQRKH